MLIWTPAFEICSLWLHAHFPTSAVLINALASLDWFQLFQKLHVSGLALVSAVELYFLAIMLDWSLKISWIYLLLSWLKCDLSFHLLLVQEPTHTSAAPVSDFTQKTPNHVGSCVEGPQSCTRIASETLAVSLAYYDITPLFSKIKTSTFLGGIEPMEAVLLHVAALCGWWCMWLCLWVFCAQWRGSY